jgi:hypothetical protein
MATIKTVDFKSIWKQFDKINNEMETIFDTPRTYTWSFQKHFFYAILNSYLHSAHKLSSLEIDEIEKEFKKWYDKSWYHRTWPEQKRKLTSLIRNLRNDLF